MTAATELSAAARAADQRDFRAKAAFADRGRTSAPLERADADVAAAIIRQIRRFGERRGADPDSWPVARAIEEEVHAMQARMVARWRRAGWSDADLAEHMGVTRQAVWQRFPREREEEE
jgi:hypothetical protein